MVLRTASGSVALPAPSSVGGRRLGSCRSATRRRRRLLGPLRCRPGGPLRASRNDGAGDPEGADDTDAVWEAMRQVVGESDDGEPWDPERDLEELDRLTAQFNAFMDGEEGLEGEDCEYADDDGEDDWEDDIDMRESVAGKGDFEVDESELRRNSDYYQMIAEESAAAAELDPEGRALNPDEAEMMQQILQNQGQAAGPMSAATRPSDGDSPEVVLLAGLRAEELVVVRVLMDQLGWTDTRVVPVTGSMLMNSTAAALSMPEPAWDQPRDASYQGGGWGAERILLFQGLRTGKQAVLVEMLEQSGLPTVGVATVTEANMGTRLGDVLAEAVLHRREMAKTVGSSLLDMVPELIYDGEGPRGRDGHSSREASGDGNESNKGLNETDGVDNDGAAGPKSRNDDTGESSAPATTAGTSANVATAKAATDADENVKSYGRGRQAESDGGVKDELPGSGEVGREQAQRQDQEEDTGANLIDALLDEMPMYGMQPGRGLQYADLHYGAMDAELASKGPTYFSTERLKEALREARQAGLGAAQLKGVLREVSASSQTNEERWEDKEEGWKFGSGTAEENHPRVAQGTDTLEDALAKAKRAGLDASTLKGVMKEVFTEQTDTTGSGPRSTGIEEGSSTATVAAVAPSAKERLQAVIRKAVDAGVKGEELKDVVRKMVGGKEEAAAILLDLMTAPEEDEQVMAEEGYMRRDAFRKAILAENKAREARGEVDAVEATTMSKTQLRATADARGLSYEELLKDAEQRGIVLREE